jgi:hypothetical protein
MITDLYKFIPPSTDNDRVLRIGRESDTRDPFSVTLVSDCEFAVAERVPQFNSSVTRS